MTKEALASKLHHREMGEEITEAESIQARADGLVVLFGYSDDNAEFRGAFHDEVGCYNGGELFLHREGVLPHHDPGCDCEHCGFSEKRSKCASIKACWGIDIYSWTYETAIPHATFEIVEGEDKYCLGIVFNVSDLPKL